MTTEWKDLVTMREVAEAQHNKWEIETSNLIDGWVTWDGKGWHINACFRGRPKQPKLCGAWAGNGPCILPTGHNRGHVDIPQNHKSGKVTVTSECWRNKFSGALLWVCPEYERVVWSPDLQRYPIGDKTGEVDEC